MAYRENEISPEIPGFLKTRQGYVSFDIIERVWIRWENQNSQYALIVQSCSHSYLVSMSTDLKNGRNRNFIGSENFRLEAEE